MSGDWNEVMKPSLHFAVTHVVSSVNSDGQCPRTLKYLHAILGGKWIVSVDCKYFMYQSVKSLLLVPKKTFCHVDAVEFGYLET